MIYSIPSESAGLTVGEFLKQNGYSRHLITRLKQMPDGITADGRSIYTSHNLDGVKRLCVRLPEESASAKIVETPMALDIVYEDDDLLILNKAAGVPIHPSQGNYDCTLANGLAYYFRQKGEPFVYRAINRLDRDTTGLLILARNPLSAAILSRMTMERSIHRKYLAVATGLVSESGTITAPIARVEGSTIERCVDETRGEYAVTSYRRLFYNTGLDCSLLQVTLETGRTHQIRVHLKHIGHPLPGDFLYNPDYRFITRQALHSYCLEFTHPVTGESLKFQAPLPPDMQFIYDIERRSPLG